MRLSAESAAHLVCGAPTAVSPSNQSSAKFAEVTLAQELHCGSQDLDNGFDGHTGRVSTSSGYYVNWEYGRTRGILLESPCLIRLDSAVDRILVPKLILQILGNLHELCLEEIH